MSGPGDFDYLCGTTVSFDDLSNQTWCIDRRLSEVYVTLSQDEVNKGVGIPYAAIKFVCHNTANTEHKGIMRMYLQIPVQGTIARGPSTRAEQAIPSFTHNEERALQDLNSKGCKAVPKLLCSKKTVQSIEDCVPGGYLNYLVWELVPGRPLNYEEFWDQDLEYRSMVREKFRAAYQELIRCGWLPIFTDLGKIIFDDETRALHISGFSRCRTVEGNPPFNNSAYALWDLVKPSNHPDPRQRVEEAMW